MVVSRFFVFFTPLAPFLTPDLDVFVVFFVFCLVLLVMLTFDGAGVPTGFNGESLDGLDVTASGCSAGPFWNFSYQLTKQSREMTKVILQME